MEYLTSLYTDVGIKKSTNQDSALLKIANTDYGRVVFCVICDGMGGLSKGELASATVIKEFNNWFLLKFPELLYNGLKEDRIKNQWEEIIYFSNLNINSYGKSNNISLGTTVAAILIAKERVFILNVGDTRVYEISNKLCRITRDQTLVEKEVEQGLLTEEQAKKDSRRNVLLQCIGATTIVKPDFYAIDAKKDFVYMLCSDGFRHQITDDEIYMSLNPYVLNDENVMNSQAYNLVELNKQRQETDNITVALIRTY